MGTELSCGGSSRLVWLRGMHVWMSVHRSILVGGTLYDILGVSPSSTRQEIKAQFYKLSLLYHPDRAETVSSSEWHREKFVQISQAYAVLSNERERQAYDVKHQIVSRGVKPDLCRPVWDPYPGYRHTADRRKSERVHQRARDFAMNSTAARWSTWADHSASDLQTINEARKKSEHEQREESSLRRSRILVTIFIVGCYLLTCR